MDKETQGLFGLVLVGAAIGIGKLLASDEKLTVRIVLGRSIVSAGLALAAAGVLAWVPGLSITAQMGIAAGLSSLGTSTIEGLLKIYVGK